MQAYKVEANGLQQCPVYSSVLGGKDLNFLSLYPSVETVETFVTPC